MGSVALRWGFWPTSGRIMSSAKKRRLLVFTTAMHTTWSRRSKLAFLCSSSGALRVISTVALECRSSTVSIICCFASRFSVIMQMIFSFVLGGDFTASDIVVAALTSILCLSRRSSRLKRS